MNTWQPILTLIVAASALGVSFFYNRSQVRIAKAKLKLDLFERRMAIYDEVTKYMKHQMAQHEQIEDATPFFESVSRARWLFDKSVLDWIENDLLSEVRKLSLARRMAKELSNGPEQAKKILAASEAGMHFHDLYGRRDEVFGPFLKMDDA